MAAAILPRRLLSLPLAKAWSPRVVQVSHQFQRGVTAVLFDNVGSPSPLRAFANQHARLLNTSAPYQASLTVRDALNKAMQEEIERDPKVFIIGEEVAQYNGAYKVRVTSHSILGRAGLAFVSVICYACSCTVPKQPFELLL